MNKVINNKVKNNIFICLLLLIIIFLSFTLIDGIFSKAASPAWDGTTIAKEFAGGNGTVDNPFLISNGPQLAYFKQVIEYNNNVYKDKYYELTDDIDLGNKNFETINENFDGHFDGHGFSIFNVKFTKAAIEDADYYGLFSSLGDASITNLIINNASITTGASSNSVLTGIIASKVLPENSATIKNVIVKGSSLNISSTTPYVKNRIKIDESLPDDLESSYRYEENAYNYLGGVIGIIGYNVEFDKIYSDVTVNSTFSTGVGSVASVINSDPGIVISKTTVTGGVDTSAILAYDNSSDTVNMERQYIVKNNGIYLDNTLVSNTDLSDDLSLNAGEYIWSITANVPTFSLATVAENSAFEFNGTSITPANSGVNNGTVTINDLESDYNYYQGLNFTEITSTSIPTGVNTHKYDDLVAVELTFDGNDINNTLLNGKAKVSPLRGENENRFVYYKYYPILHDNRGDYIRIELIDNPFSVRPVLSNVEYGFNGWVCNNANSTNCNNTKLVYDSAYYTRYAEVTVGSSREIKLFMNASWVPASVVTTTAAASNLKNKDDKVPMPKTDIFENQWNGNYYTLVYDSTVTRGNSNTATNYLLAANAYYKTNQNGNTYTKTNTNTSCAKNTTCYVYKIQKVASANEAYNGGNFTIYPNIKDTYASSSNSVTSVNVNSFDTTYMKSVAVDFIPFLNDGDNASGWYYKNGNNIDIIQPSDSYAIFRKENYANYYYNVTRDTNICRITNTVYGTDIGGITKPVTVTGISIDGTSTSGLITMSTTNYGRTTYYNITATNDLVLENIKTTALNTSLANVNTTVANNVPGNAYIASNSKNVKIGRNFSNNSGAQYAALLGVRSSGTGGYKTIVESGYYQNLNSTTAGGTMSEITVIGSDYDRAKNDNNRVAFTGGIGGYNSGSSNVLTNSSGDHKLFAFYNIIKSGHLGYALTNSNNNIGFSVGNDRTAGAYIGAWSDRTMEAPTGIEVQGGVINKIIGSYGFKESTTEVSSYIAMKNGNVRQIFGGAATSESYGHRVISVTGGKVEGSVLGGSDSNTATGNTDGILRGNTLVYVGGSAEIGTGTTTIAKVTPGSVFGAGAGNTNPTTTGTVYNSHVVINGGIIHGGVYGGGNNGSTGTQLSATSTAVVDIYSGNINEVFGGSNNNGFSKNDYRASSKITINIDGGNINNVYGGSNANGTCNGSTEININNCTINQNVYGGGKGSTTYVTGNVNVNVGSTTKPEYKPIINGNVYGGSAFGTVNGSANANSSTYKTAVNINSGTVKSSVFGGAQGNNTYTPKVLGAATTTINGGNVGNVFGGNDAKGSVTGNVNVYLKGGNVGNAFAGGNSTGQNSPDIFVQGSTVNNVFGGCNNSGDVVDSNVTVSSGTIGNVYGGNNAGGKTNTTFVTVNGGTFSGDIYGGGKNAESGTTNVNVNNTLVNNIYGGGQSAQLTNSSNVNLNGCTFDSAFGGSNYVGVVPTTNVNVSNGATGNNLFGAGNQANSTNTNVNLNNGVITNVYGGGNNASATNNSIVNIKDGSYDYVYGGGNAAGDNKSKKATINYDGGVVQNMFGGSNATGDITDTVLNISNKVNSTLINAPDLTIYGGNNAGGYVETTTLNIDNISFNTLYGGGNEAKVGKTIVTTSPNTTLVNLYGGGNAAGVTDLSNSSTSVVVNGSTITGNLFGGGNNGIVQGNTSVRLTNANVYGNAYAGGNGSAAIVYGTSNIGVEGNSVIGTPTSKAPKAGCVYGSGNAANTGAVITDLNQANNYNSNVNISGGHIYGNVYGGARQAIVYGVATVNVGKNLIADNTFIKSDIEIDGSVYGGGESKNENSTVFDYLFKSVKVGIDVNIDGTSYTSSSFLLKGDIFGSGNASSSDGYSNVSIKNLGSADSIDVLKSIQRTDYCTIDSSFIELTGTNDVTNESNSTYLYSLNHIKNLIIKNGTTLLVSTRGYAVEHLVSGYDKNGTLALNTATIDDNGNLVSLDVDNRLYAKDGVRFNVNIPVPKENPNGEGMAKYVYGKVEGMTFFGMYKDGNNNTYDFGVYDPSVSVGDSVSNYTEMSGTSYVAGANFEEYDYTVDGFYTHDNRGSTVKITYIDPAGMGGDEKFNIWRLGTEPGKQFNVELFARPQGTSYSTALSLDGFNYGNVTVVFDEFDRGNLIDGSTYKPKDQIPRIAASENDANTNFGLSFKGENEEWISNYSTNLIGANTMNGDTKYVTDVSKSTPIINFYLYHSKNVTSDKFIGESHIRGYARYSSDGGETLDIVPFEIVVKLFTEQKMSNNYSTTINYGKYYEPFSSNVVNITNKSQFSNSYSLSLFGSNNGTAGLTMQDVYGKNARHVLTTSEALPVGTKITMIDYAQADTPLYYIYEVSSLAQINYDTNTYEYELSDFRLMGSTSSTLNKEYDEAYAASKYFYMPPNETDPTKSIVDEEFIFIFDFLNTTTVFNKKDVIVGLNLVQTESDGSETVYASIDSSDAANVKFSTYPEDNGILHEEIDSHDNFVYTEKNANVTINTSINYNKDDNNLSIIDTNYISKAMGLNVRFKNSSGDYVGANNLFGTYFMYDEESYFVDSDGVFRIPLAGKVSKLNAKLILNTSEALDEGDYTIEYTLFASEDGLHNSDNKAVTENYSVKVIKSDSFIYVDCEDESKLIIGETGVNALGAGFNRYIVNVNSNLKNIDVRLEIKKRETKKPESLDYKTVPFSTLFKDNYTGSNNEVSLGITSLANNHTSKTIQLNINNKEDLLGGTYQLIFKLYDNGVLIDSEMKYVIVDKNVVSEYEDPDLLDTETDDETNDETDDESDGG